MKHDEQLTLFDGAKVKLREYGIRPHISELEQVNVDVKDLERQALELEKKIDSSKKESRDLEQKYRSITEYLGFEENKEKSAEKRKKSRTQSIL